MKSYDVQFVEDYKVLKSQYTRLKNTLEFWVDSSVFFAYIYHSSILFGKAARKSEREK